jgi:transcriptional regulator with XRE-family HTH domain
MPRNPTAVDQHVGARVRAARLEAGKSQTEVAESLGLTFQQVQKYEKGTNRISAGKLHELSRLFDTPVQFCFDGMAGAVGRRGNSKGAAALDPLTRFGGTSDCDGIREGGSVAAPSARAACRRCCAARRPVKLISDTNPIRHPTTYVSRVLD